jgi:hypothetical protein
VRKAGCWAGLGVGWLLCVADTHTRGGLSKRMHLRTGDGEVSDQIRTARLHVWWEGCGKECGQK